MSAIIPSLDRMAGLFERYKKTYLFKFCDIDEIDDVVVFIDKYWKKGHILVQSRKLMDWQHLDKINNRYNFVIAKHKQTGEIHAILGFITTQFFDKKIKNILLWGVIWKTREDVKAFGIGVLLYYYLKITLNIETICLSGISEDGKKSYESLGFFTGREEQYFFPNPITKEFYLAKNIDKYQDPSYKNTKDWKIKNLSPQEYELVDNNTECFKFNSQYKSKEYYKNRYFYHPIYKYHFYAISQGDAIKAIMVLRKCYANNRACIRIIEYIGDYAFLENIKESINDMLVKGNYEYIDLVLTGIEDKILKRGGFVNIRSDSDIVIPNYFEPFLQKNIDIGYAYTSVDSKYKLIIAKGDADQDRPNLLNSSEGII